MSVLALTAALGLDPAAKARPGDLIITMGSRRGDQLGL